MITNQEVENRIYELFENFGLDISLDTQNIAEDKDQYVSDFQIEVNGPGNIKARLVAEFKKHSDVPQLSSAVQKIKEYQKRTDVNSHPLIIVPYMGNVGAEFCESKDVSWMDLSGNAYIKTKNIFINFDGRPNKYKSPGRPSNVFAPKSSRVARFLLRHPNNSYRQKTIADETELNRSYVSKIVKRLEEKNLILKSNSGITVRDPELMLDAWQEKYDFSDHEIIKGTVPTKSSQKALGQLAEKFEEISMNYAATGLGAAWLYTKYADFRLMSFYLRNKPDEELLNEISFKKTARGHNVWLLIPKDKGVMHGSKKVNGITCVHPIQLYLDLKKGHPERANEAAVSLKKEYINWEKSGYNE